MPEAKTYDKTHCQLFICLFWLSMCFLCVRAQQNLKLKSYATALTNIRELKPIEKL